MKLDSKIIGALIIGISILISTFFYAKILTISLVSKKDISMKKKPAVLTGLNIEIWTMPIKYAPSYSLGLKGSLKPFLISLTY